MEDLEQRDADNDVVDHDHCEPPEGEADGHGEPSDGGGRLKARPLLEFVNQEHHGDDRGAD